MKHSTGTPIHTNGYHVLNFVVFDTASMADLANNQIKIPAGTPTALCLLDASLYFLYIGSSAIWLYKNGVQNTVNTVCWSNQRCLRILAAGDVLKLWTGTGVDNPNARCRISLQSNFPV